jgi:hypothetical protein
MKRLAVILVVLIQFMPCSQVFSQDASEKEKEISISSSIAGVTSVDSWKCTEYIPNIDSKCRFRTIYIDPLKSEAIPKMQVEILEWVSYLEPTTRLIAKKSIDVNSNNQTAAEAGKLKGEQSIGCCSLENIRWEGLKLKYEIQIAKRMFFCELNHLAEKNFNVDCIESLDEASHPPSVGRDTPLSPVCWPPHYAGITPGVTTDSEVQRLLGTGIVRDEIDELLRYFVDPGASATLHVKSCTDLIVCEVEVQEGIAVKQTEVGEATSKWFSPLAGFGNWHALHLGSTKDEVRKNLGEPVKGSPTDTWQYDSTCTCEIPSFFTVYFKDNRIYKVVF